MKIKRSIATVGILLLAVVLPLMVACEINAPMESWGKRYIVFDTMGGSEIAFIEIDLDAIRDNKGHVPNILVPRPEDPTRAGHNFEGWYVYDYDFQEKILFDFDKPIDPWGRTIYARWSIDITFATKPLPDAVKGRHYDATVGDVLYINEALLGEIESVEFDVDRSKGSLFGSWDLGNGIGGTVVGFGYDGSIATDFGAIPQSVPIGVYNFEVEVEIKGLSVYSQAHYSITLKQTFSIRVVDPE